MTLKIKDADGQTKYLATTGAGTSDDPLKTQQSITGAVAINQPLPAGENNIGKVEVTAMPPLSVGDINVEVGEVAVSNFPTIFQVSNFPVTQTVAGSVSVSNFPTSFQVSNLPATQTIAGSVGVTNFPTSFQVSNFPTSFEIGNFPDTQAIAGSVSVSNFPTSFQISNLPATQTIAGSVSVSNFPTSFQVSNFPTSFQVSNFPATQTIAGSVSVSNFPTSFQVSNFPATQPVSATSLPLPLDAATATNQGTQLTRLAEIRDRLPASPTVSMSAIATDATSGDKTILTPTSGKALRISSLCLVMASATAITLKKASTAMTGAMTVSELVADFPIALALAVDQTFVINVGSAVAVNGFVTWWEA
ncbi:hypothetical protein A6S26_05290 [Nostoc sp. ATCC 43529]|nr:hypothetical protein A6S26_05290 [Nostoc sp. ATCC 43529]